MIQEKTYRAHFTEGNASVFFVLLETGQAEFCKFQQLPHLILYPPPPPPPPSHCEQDPTFLNIVFEGALQSGNSLFFCRATDRRWFNPLASRRGGNSTQKQHTPPKTVVP